MKLLPGLYLLLAMLLSPSPGWAADETSAGSGSDASTEQSTQDETYEEEEPDCE